MRSFALVVLAPALVLSCSKEPPAAQPAPATSASATPAAVASVSAAPAVASASAAPSASTAPAAPVEVAVGKPVPKFTARAHDGVDVSSATVKGKPLVVYFYPKDETPGCTKEACAFRDAWDKLAKTNVVLLGVSADDVESHIAFASHHKLPFHLVTDRDGSLAKLFGVPPMGRQSFVVDADGNVKKIYRTVDVTKHASEILADLK